MKFSLLKTALLLVVGICIQGKASGQTPEKELLPEKITIKKILDKSLKKLDSVQDFKSNTFEKHVNFSESVFDSSADFTDAQFKKTVDFSCATFNQWLEHIKPMK